VPESLKQESFVHKLRLVRFGSFSGLNAFKLRKLNKGED